MDQGKKDPSSTNYTMDTMMIHGAFESMAWNYGDHLVPPISASNAYRLETVARGAEGFTQFANPEFNRHQIHPIYIYDRLDEPSRSMLEYRLAAAEGGETAICFATGMAAISAAICTLVHTGQSVVAHKLVYGCTFSLLKNWLPRLGITTKWADLTDTQNLAPLLDNKTKVIYFETPSNPTLEMIDIGAIRAMVDEHNRDLPPADQTRIIVDNTFATPWCQRPLSLGAHMVVASLTKDIGGFGTDMGGMVCCERTYESDLMLYRKDFGAPLSSRSSWAHLVYGLPTLALRIRKQQENAVTVARFLAEHPKVEQVFYPGLSNFPQRQLAEKQLKDPEGNFAPGIMVYFRLKGGPEDARQAGARLMDAIARDSLAITLAVSLGQIRTLIEHPSSMTHAAVPVELQKRVGIDPGGVRLSLGIEGVDDIITDLQKGLESA